MVPPTLGFMLPDGSQGPPGYKAWVKTWAYTEQQRNEALFFQITCYEDIKIPPAVFDGNPDADRVREMLDQMVKQSGNRVPASLDDGFRDVADRALARMAWVDLAKLRAAQTIAMWSPWLNIVPDAYRENTDDIWAGTHVSWSKAMEHKGEAVGRFVMWTYRFLLSMSFLLATVLALIRYLDTDTRCLIAGTWAAIILRLVISVPGLFIEHRYTITISPFMELVCVLMAVTMLQNVKRGRALAA